MSHNVYTIDTHTPAKPAATPRPRRRISPAWASAVGIVLCAAAGIVIWKTWPQHLPSPDGDHVVLAKFVGTEQFAGLPLEKKEQYVRPLMDNTWELFEAVRTNKLTREEAERGMQNAGMIAVSIHARNYSALPTQAQRDAYLDKLIDEQERMVPGILKNFRSTDSSAKPAAGAQASATPPAGGPPRGMMDATKMKARIENTDPLSRARIAEFMGDMRGRRDGRGLPPVGPR